MPVALYHLSLKFLLSYFCLYFGLGLLSTCECCFTIVFIFLIINEVKNIFNILPFVFFLLWNSLYVSITRLYGLIQIFNTWIKYFSSNSVTTHLTKQFDAPFLNWALSNREFYSFEKNVFSQKLFFFQACECLLE